VRPSPLTLVVLALLAETLRTKRARRERAAALPRLLRQHHPR